MRILVAVLFFFLLLLLTQKTAAEAAEESYESLVPRDNSNNDFEVDDEDATGGQLLAGIFTVPLLILFDLSRWVADFATGLVYCTFLFNPCGAHGKCFTRTCRNIDPYQFWALRMACECDLGWGGDSLSCCWSDPLDGHCQLNSCDVECAPNCSGIKCRDCI